MSELVVTGLGITCPGVAKPSDAAAPRQEPSPGWFDVSCALPGRGYKRLPAACQYLLAAARNALADADAPFDGVPDERRGLVVATNNAAMELTEHQDGVILASSADEIGPLTAPFFVLSLFASRLATEHGVRGFCLTANSPRTAGLQALRLAGRALACGRADLLLVGVTEERLPESEPGSSHSDCGAAVLVCGPAASTAAETAYGDCRIGDVFLEPGGEPDPALTRAWNVVCAGAPGPVLVDAVLDDSAIGGAVASWLARRPVETRMVRAGAGCLTPMRHVVGALAGGGPERVVITAAAEGAVTMARVRPARHAGEQTISHRTMSARS
ncbi:3-oxoacyl-ACP synthase [Streptomyces sp. RB6PN25]|uniref:3-oxoacyl-ACP synthase n=1 Tax=Streptomyces humicola TaxID=2953240 RepID=A0ABT1PUV0_9ACTN|nr:beta-ketoacyl synthase N-terminal-like domain-containing protein [Streptomyces humicola]MCQ4080918.1 3-oxoacyl-ACP synthase [Streptomyces humicola]